jgi:ABC-type amino acid transport system permease subunit
VVAERQQSEETIMNFISATPLLLSILVGFLLGLVAVGLLRLRHHPVEVGSAARPDDVLVGFVALAAFAMGAFLTYLLFGLLL